MKAVIDNAIPYIKGVLEPYAEVLYREGIAFRREDVADADLLIIRTRTRCNASLLDGSSVKMIATATIGFDHIDLEYCQKHGIEVVTAQGCNAAGVLQWVAAALALLSRKDGWEPQQRTLGIVGVGNVGRLVEQYARAWGFNVLRCDPPRKEREGGDFISLEELLSVADIVTLHTPLDRTTHHLINNRTMALMHDDAVLINASRGEVASTETLLKASQRLLIDVWEHEPEIDRELLAKAIVATPHIAGYSSQGKANAAAMVVRAAAERFALPLTEWYPEQVRIAERQEIDWQTMCLTIQSHCDIEAESAKLKAAPEGFEAMRNGYHYREEYF
ncbi:MAG: 4-phosphoerythronate dehydrogenase [Alistipes sp.]|nr:4-phosphoerythronate dehydrogenase [Alistipes sp.]